MRATSLIVLVVMACSPSAPPVPPPSFELLVGSWGWGTQAYWGCKLRLESDGFARLTEFYHHEQDVSTEGRARLEGDLLFLDGILDADRALQLRMQDERWGIAYDWTPANHGREHVDLYLVEVDVTTSPVSVVEQPLVLPRWVSQGAGGS